MNRVIVVPLLSAAVCLASAGTTRADDPPGKGPAELQGCWKLVSVEVKGESRDPLGAGEPRWVIKGDTVAYGGETIIRFTADPATTPKIIDLKFRDPERVYEGIYTIEKDTLKVCLNGRSEAKDRPGKFSTKDQDDWRLLVFEREKAAPAKATEGLTGFAGLQLATDDETRAVVINAPLKGSPAEKAGLKKDDVVLKVGGTAVKDLQGTVNAVRQSKPGDKLVIRVSRDGKEMDVTVTVGVLPFNWVAGLE